MGRAAAVEGADTEREIAAVICRARALPRARGKDKYSIFDSVAVDRASS